MSRYAQFGLQAPAIHCSQGVRHNADWLKAVFDAGPYAMIVSDENGKIVMANDHVETLLGYPPDELEGQAIDLLVPQRHRNDHVQYRKMFSALPSTRQMGHHRDIRARCKDGSECSVEVGLHQIETQEGNFTVSALRDLKDWTASQELLREYADKLRHLYELSSFGIALTDLNGRLLEFNPAFQRICGHSGNALKSLDFRQLTPDKYEVDEARQLEQLEHNQRYGPYEKEYIRPDGSQVPVRLNGVMITARNGEAYIWSIVEDISAQRQAEGDIRKLAYFDPLTGLPNRTLLHDRLRQAVLSSGRTGMYGAVLLIDLDNFKTINDTRGHGTGDLLLIEVADLLRNCAQEGDTLARLGGDEFVLLLVDIGIDRSEAAGRVKAMADKILACLSRRIALGADSYQCSASVGATLFQGADTSNEVALKQADLAMYRAKKAGRNTACFFDPVMEEAILARTALESDLRSALDDQQFALYYQAQVIGDSQLTGAEALLRWNHPRRGMVPPDLFIPVAEEMGLILTIGRWVLETACTRLAYWATVPQMAHLTMSVNVSVHQFSDADFVPQVLAIVQASGANPKFLKMELTESVLMIDVAEVIGKMSTLQALGIRFSLDDFGTGYSSLAYLKRLPLNQLKIDQSFVRDVLTDPNDAAIARTVVALAHSLQLTVIAEGVETQGQKEFLIAAGCIEFQGYLFGRPMPAGEFERSCTQAENGREGEPTISALVF